MEIKETEAEVTRWREACELEVEAGKVEIRERDKVVKIESYAFQVHKLEKSLISVVAK